MREIRIRHLKPTDEKEFRLFLMALNKRTVDYYGRWDNLEKADEIAKTQCSKLGKDEVGLIALDGSEIIGYSHLMFASKSSRAHSCGFGIVINQHYQGKGYGEQLMKETIKLAKDMGKKKIWLHVYDFNKSAIKLYKRLGFVQEGLFKKEEVKNGKYVNLISMAKWI